MWLDGERASTFDGEIGVSCPLASDVQGGLKGVSLIGLIERARGDKVELAEGKAKHLAIKSGTMKVQLPVLDIKRQPKWPTKLHVNDPIVVTDDLRKALALGMKAVSTNESRPDFLGTTILPAKDRLDLFTSDGSTATWLICDRPNDWPDTRLAWPRRFCEQLVKLGDGGMLHLTKGNSLLVCEDDKTELLGRDLRITNPVDYPAMMNRMVPENFTKLLYDIPEGLSEAITRVNVLQQNKNESTIKIEVAARKMTMSLETGRGSIVDELKIDPLQPDLAIKVSPMFLSRAIAQGDAMLLGESCVLVYSTETEFLHVISAMRAMTVRPSLDDSEIPF